MKTVHVTLDITYAVVDGLALSLDLYRPESESESVPVVLYLHGGGWRVGDKSDGADERLRAFAARGVAVASANYRLVTDQIYPAQIHDTKAAIRWLRARGSELGLSTDKIGVWGASAGAYLTSLAALTPNDPAFEGRVGDHLDQSTAVDAAVHWFGQSDLVVNSRLTWLEKEILNPPVEGALFGVEDVESIAETVRAASPLARVTADAPPFLIAHGDRDRVLPASESIALHDALVRAGAESTLVLLGGCGHEDPNFDRPDHLALTSAFLSSHLQTAV
ncbi:alpha/beta hydrolase [Rhodococcoides fascians]|uniref:alpha/beta hydrolase n=1 Tax=Rhodococcoides fascians TaxID=1828 RepID=UPI00050BDCCF|nr:alpha/beta hydrolase [Rhodococcus fascians]